MIITRSPLRITLGGGGTDLPSYYEEHGGFLIAGAIDKYVYLHVHRTFEPGLIIRYSKTERVESVEQIQHPIIRESLKLADIRDANLEITSMADIPAGTGLGSSGSFTTGLLKALYTHKRAFIHPQDLAKQACQIEIEILKEPIGKQDQYIAAFGGVTCFEFLPGGDVKAWPLAISEDTLSGFHDNVMMFFTGYNRSASAVLKEQKVKSEAHDPSMIQNLHFVKEMGYRSKDALESGNLSDFGKLLHTHWLHKKQRSGGMSNPQIDRWYEIALENGALGGKLIGAGGGGFLMFYTENRQRLRKALRAEGLRELQWNFDFEGTRTVNS